mgnify:CR=1 FL=1
MRVFMTPLGSHLGLPSKFPTIVPRSSVRQGQDLLVELHEFAGSFRDALPRLSKSLLPLGLVHLRGVVRCDESVEEPGELLAVLRQFGDFVLSEDLCARNYVERLVRKRLLGVVLHEDGKFAEALFIFQLGAVDSTVDCLVRESTNTSDGSGQTLSGKSATQLTSSDDNKQVVINVKSEELSTGYRYLRGRMTAGNGTTNLVSCVALGLVPRFGPASDDDLTDVAQVVT